MGRKRDRDADSHEELGVRAFEAGRWKSAEAHFRAAILASQGELERDGAKVPWGFLENRPYLRALGNMALVLAQQQRWDEALAIHERLLELNPDDNQGIRWLIGVERLRVGDVVGAIAACERCADEEVGCAFALALAHIRAGGPAGQIGAALLAGFGKNRYVAPMLLGETWDELDGFHGTNMAEPEWADDVVAAQLDLWRATPRALELLRLWWTAPSVVAWRRRLDDIMVQLRDREVSPRRSALVNEWLELCAPPKLRELVKTVRLPS